MTYKDSPNFDLVFTSQVHNVSFYVPKDIGNQYHTDRYVMAGEQDIYSAGGTTKQLIEAMMAKQLEICNTGNKKTIISDCATIANNLLFRLKYPVDRHAALRMAAIYLLTDGEDEIPTESWIAKKVAWCIGGIDEKGEKLQSDDEMYRFFLTIGIEYTPSWSQYKNTLEKTYHEWRDTSLIPLTI